MADADLVTASAKATGPAPGRTAGGGLCPRSVRIRLILIVLLAVLPSAGLMLYLWTAEKAQAQRGVRKEAVSVAHQLSFAEGELIRLTRGLLVSIAENRDVRSLDPARVEPVLRALRPEYPSVANLGLILPDGHLAASSLPARMPMDLSDRDYFQRALTERKFACGSFQIGRITGRPGINFGYPILDDDGQPLAVLFAAVDLTDMEDNLMRHFARTLPERAVVVRTDEGGIVLGRYPEAAGLGLVAPEIASLRQVWNAGGGSEVAVGPDGVSRIYAVSSVGGNLGAGRVRVLLGTPVNLAYRDANRSFARAILLLVLGTLVGGTAAWFLGNRVIAGPLRALVRATRRLGSGERECRLGPPYSRTEYGELARAFDEMATALSSREQEVRSAAERFRSLVADAPYGIYLTTPGGRIVEANPAILRILGCRDIEEALGLDLATDVYRDPEDRRRILNRLEVEGQAREEGLEWRRRDGEPIVVNITCTAQFERGGGIRLIETFVEDTTRTRRLEQELRHSQKMEAVGRLASTVAHDFNNILTSVTGQSSLIQKRLPDEEACRRAAIEIERAAERATALTRQLLLFGRRDVANAEPLAPGRVAAEMEEMLRRLLGEKVELTLDLCPRAGVVMADRGSLEQVIMNLAVNARDAMPEGGRIRISTENVELDETYLSRHLDAAPGPYVLLVVSDDGIGMDEATRARIFEPFFTTKEKGKGTGLGLSTTYAIVRQSKGSIWVYSEPGKGTSFKIYLPRIGYTEEGSPEEAPRITVEEVRGGRETVLVVEDDEGVRSLVHEVLEGSGYRVLSAADGRTAEALTSGSAEKIDLLISDMVLPDVGGPDLERRLSRGEPGLRSMFMSGYSRNASPDAERLADRPFIQKPFTPDDLLRAVRQTLDS